MKWKWTRICSLNMTQMALQTASNQLHKAKIFGCYRGSVQLLTRVKQLPASWWNQTADLCLTRSLRPVWPGCCMITGDSWPLWGLLGVSPESSGYSWSSDLCCWTPHAPSDHRTPPGRQTERVRWESVKEEGKGGQERTGTWNSR